MADNAIVMSLFDVVSDLVFCLEFISGSCCMFDGAMLLIVRMEQ